ncbi:MAG: MFS transporter, partial [Deltaproteobacteria bacterium]|nr:MFS transporter [Deltaproteobacteria bacterium]
SRLGLLGGSYTAAAAAAGVTGSRFLDRFDRRTALGVAMAGLVAATALAAVAEGLTSLLAARVLAGIFGGPTASLAMAIVTDSVPVARRGRAMGAVMGSFSLATVLGVPFGLELARHLGWRAPFLGVAALGAILLAFALRRLPPLRAHLGGQGAPARGRRALLGRLPLLAYGTVAVVMIGVFSVVPNLSTYLQRNLGYPRDSLSTLYLFGGLASLVTMRLVGAWVDRFGAFPVVVLGTALHVAAVGALVLAPGLGVPVVALFTFYMLSGSFRMVPMQALSSRVPHPADRAAYLSLGSAVHHAASAIGSISSGFLLATGPRGELIGMERVAIFAIGLALLVPFGARLQERWLGARDAAT